MTTYKTYPDTVIGQIERAVFCLKNDPPHKHMRADTALVALRRALELVGTDIAATKRESAAEEAWEQIDKAMSVLRRDLYS